MRTYSIYEAKARLSEIVRAVRERGESFTVTWHGKPVAEIRPVEPSAGEGLEARLKELERRGVVRPVAVNASAVRPGRDVPGALQRFLADRDE